MSKFGVIVEVLAIGKILALSCNSHFMAEIFSQAQKSTYQISSISYKLHESLVLWPKNMLHCKADIYDFF